MSCEALPLAMHSLEYIVWLHILQIPQLPRFVHEVVLTPRSSRNGHSPQEIGRLITHAGVAKAKPGLSELRLKSFLGGVLIAIGGHFDLIVAGGTVNLQESNPSVATLIAAFTFPTGFVLVIWTNVEPVTSNMFIMMCTTLQRKTSIYNLGRN